MSDHVARMTAEWSPGRAVTPGVATTAERARGMTKDESEAYGEVLDAAFSARLVPEPAKADAPRKGSKAWAIQEACRIVAIAFHGIADYDEASDCFCSESRDQDYRNGGHALAFVEAAVREKLAREKAPAPPAEAKHHEEDCVCRKCRPELHSAQPPAEAKGGMSREEVESFVGDIGKLPPGTPQSIVDGFRGLLATDAALRARAREAEERAGKWRRELSAACELSERAREIVVSALNQPPEHFYDKHDNGEWSAEHIAFAIRSLFRERDEAREQRDDAVRREEAENRENRRLRDDLAAANARAEEAERNYDRLRDISLCRRQFPDGVVPGGTEECARGWHDWYEKENAARLRAEAERDAYKQDRDLTAHRLAAANDAWEATAAQFCRNVDYFRGIVDQIGEMLGPETKTCDDGSVVPDVLRAKVAEIVKVRLARLAAAEAEVKRLRLAYDDPSLDGTDGAHPAWWRGSDAGVAGAVRIVNEALDEPLPLAGCVGGADLERVRQRIAALRERSERLERAGDDLARYVGAEWPALTRAWAAAKAPAAGGGR